MRLSHLSCCVFLFAVVLAGFSRSVAAEPSETLYDESKVPAYTLPDPLMTSDGQQIENAELWRTRRRPEILKLFEEHVYGRSPAAPEGLTFEVTGVDPDALNGKATRKEVAIYLRRDKSGPCLELLIYLPNRAMRALFQPSWG